MSLSSKGRYPGTNYQLLYPFQNHRSVGLAVRKIYSKWSKSCKSGEDRNWQGHRWNCEIKKKLEFLDWGFEDKILGVVEWQVQEVSERAYIGAAWGIVWAGHDGDDDNERDRLVDKELGDFEDKIEWEERDWA